MKVLLYLEGKSVHRKSVLSSFATPNACLDPVGIPLYTIADILGDYDVVHINTTGQESLLLHVKLRDMEEGYYAYCHSTKEISNSFIGLEIYLHL